MSSNDLPPNVELETVYLVEAHYAPDAADRRPVVRAEHLARAAELKRQGTFIEVGAYADGLTSSIILVRAPDDDSALEIVRKDVYVRSGVWAEIGVRPFGRVA